MSTQDSPRIFLARHCKTRWNLEGRLQGSQDLPLCDAGRVEAHALLPRLDRYRFERIISSPYLRALQTATIFADHLGIPLSAHMGLRELDHGLWEGEEIARLLHSPESEYARWLKDATRVAVPQGEDLESARARIVHAVVEIANVHVGEKLLIVTHKHIRAVLNCSLKGLGLAEFGSQIDEGVEPVEIPSEELRRVRELVS